MTTAKDIEQAATLFRKLYYEAALNSPHEAVNNEMGILRALHNLDVLHKRMTESNRPDFIGGEI